MDFKTYIETFSDENEKPLDRMVTDGGMCSIFRTIGCIGDSLSSGEFESYSPDGVTGYHDMYEYSWGQFIARAAGCTVRNFSRGGMTAKEYLDSFGNTHGLFSVDIKCQAYIIALGVNEMYRFGLEKFGTLDDALNGTHAYGDDFTIAGTYGEIIRRYRAIQPRAVFFLMTCPYEPHLPAASQEYQDRHAQLLRDLADRLDNTYVIDLRKYAPVYDATLRKKFYLGGHMNPMGYRFTADMVMSYIDYIVRHNTDKFKEVGFIGTDLHGII